MAAGLPTVRVDASQRRALDAADRMPPTCRPDHLLRELAGGTPATTMVVVNEQRIVLGRLRPGTGAGTTTDGSARVEDVMEPGPATVRAHEPLPPLLERMARRQVDEMIVTTPDGELLGVVRRSTEDR